MKKWLELPVAAAVCALIAVPVAAGVYVGMTTDKASHSAQAAETHGEGAHSTATEPAAGGTGGGHPPTVSNHDSGLEPGVPGVSGGHAGEYVPPSLYGDGEYQGHGETPKPAPCLFQELVGHKLDDSVVAKIKAAGKAYRSVKPGMPLTMDYSADRINLDVDDHGVITRVWCG